MSDLIVVGYNEEHQAEEVRLKLLKMRHESLVDLEDAVVAVRDKSGKVKLHQIHNLATAGAISGGFWGALVGLLFMSPILGAAIGAGAGAIGATLSDVGIDDNFMTELSRTLQPGSSALFVLVRRMSPDKVLPQLQGTGGKILRTSLSNEDEARLQAALDAAKASN